MNIRRKTQTERTEETIALIKKAALELLAETGLKSLTFNTIAERADCSRSLTQYHFKSKENLINTLAADAHETVLQHLKTIEQTHESSIERIIESIKLMFQQYFNKKDIETRGIYALYNETIAHPNHQHSYDFVQKFHSGFSEWFSSQIERGVARNEISANINSEELGFVIFSTLFGISYQSDINPNFKNQAKALKVCKEIISMLQKHLAH